MAATPPLPLEFDVPATCANLGPGFGVLAVALDLPTRVSVVAGINPGHTVAIRGTSEELRRDSRHDPLLRAMQAAARRFDVKLPPDLAITTDSAVPPASGLGTQSGRFAAGVAITARLGKKPIPIDDMLDLCVELGADASHAAAALAGGLTVVYQTHAPNPHARHRIVQQQLHPDWRFVLACPETRVPTADARRILPPTLPHGAAARTAGRLVGLLHALAEGDAERLERCLLDEVHVPFRRRLVPGMEAAMAAGRAAGAAGVTISGHGPAVVALTTDERACAQIAEAMRAAFAASEQLAETRVLTTTPRGALARA